jgi:hypothetical protein
MSVIQFLLLTPWNQIQNGFQIQTLLFLAGYRNMSLDRRLGLLQANDREFKDADQFRLEIHGNCTLWK